MSERPRFGCVLRAMCGECEWLDEHYDPPRWHSWAGPEDVSHAFATYQADPSDSQCACPCADGPRLRAVEQEGQL